MVRELLAVALAAGLAVGLAACDGDDSGPSSPVELEPCAPGTTGLVVLADGEPVVGRQAYFNAADGHLIGRCLTGADGRAALDTDAPIFASLIDGDAATGRHATYWLEAGQEIRIGTPTPAAAPEVLGTVSLTISSPPGAQRIRVSAEPTNAAFVGVGEVIAVPVYDRAGDSTFSIAIEAFPDELDAWPVASPLAYAVVEVDRASVAAAGEVAVEVSSWRDDFVLTELGQLDWQVNAWARYLESGLSVAPTVRPRSAPWQTLELAFIPELAASGVELGAWWWGCDVRSGYSGSSSEAFVEPPPTFEPFGGRGETAHLQPVSPLAGGIAIDTSEVVVTDVVNAGIGRHALRLPAGLTFVLFELVPEDRSGAVPFADVVVELEARSDLNGYRDYLEHWYEGLVPGEWSWSTTEPDRGTDCP